MLAIYNVTDFVPEMNPGAVVRMAVGGVKGGWHPEAGREGPAWVGAFISARSPVSCVGAPAAAAEQRPPTPFLVMEFPARLTRTSSALAWIQIKGWGIKEQ